MGGANADRRFSLVSLSLSSEKQNKNVLIYISIGSVKRILGKRIILKTKWKFSRGEKKYCHDSEYYGGRKKVWRVSWVWLRDGAVIWRRSEGVYVEDGRCLWMRLMCWWICWVPVGVSFNVSSKSFVFNSRRGSKCATRHYTN